MFHVSQVNFLSKSNNTNGEKTGRKPVKLFHRSPVNRRCGEFLRFPSFPSFEMEMSVVRSDPLSQPALFHSQVCDNKFSICNVRASEMALADSESWRVLSLNTSLDGVVKSWNCDNRRRQITRWIMILGFEDSALLWHKKILFQNSDHPILHSIQWLGAEENPW